MEQNTENTVKNLWTKTQLNLQISVVTLFELKLSHNAVWTTATHNGCKKCLIVLIRLQYIQVSHLAWLTWV